MNPETIRQVTFGGGPTVVGGIQPPSVEVVHKEHRKARERRGWRIERVVSAEVHGAGRNQPCRCGSGKKSKRCCGR